MTYQVFGDTIIQLQRQINKIENFSKGVGLDINMDKTGILLFRNGGKVKKNRKMVLRRKYH